MEFAVPAKESREARKLREQQVAHEVRDLSREERLRAWREKTGKSKAALYCRLAELDHRRTVRSENGGRVGCIWFICFCICFQPPELIGFFLNSFIFSLLWKTRKQIRECMGIEPTASFVQTRHWF
jgi:hypothetical protein